MSIRVENLYHTYNPGTPFERCAIEDVSLEIGDGEFVAIIGPNGAGKTTFIKSICGLIEISNGKIYLFGKDISEKSNLLRARTRIGYVPQILTIDHTFPVNVFDVVSMANADNALAALKEVGMQDFTTRQIGKLSVGQRQKVFIARALALRPELLILDEPASGADSESSDNLYNLLENLKEKGVAVVMISHDETACKNVCDKIYYMNGKLEIKC